MSALETLLLASPAVVADGSRTRALASGIDPSEYAAVTAGLEATLDWQAAFRAAAHDHAQLAAQAERDGRLRSAGEAYLDAARWSHFATTVPHPDRAGHARAVAEAADAYRRAMAHLDPGAQRIELPHPAYPLVGILRRPAGAARPPVVLLVSGLDSSKEEFHYVAEALLARGVATFAFDGPGQGELSASSTVVADYERVVSRAVDVLSLRDDVDTARVGMIALSLGGYYGVRAAAFEPRIRALATVTGVCTLELDAMPEWVAETVAQRAGGMEAAHAFAAQVDAHAFASRVAVPLLVVGAGADPLVPLDASQRVAGAAREGGMLIVADGDHLCANRRWLWLGRSADWLAGHLR
jgi:alpha-beta hydrolase superfamily lysophospholipase